MLAAASGRGAGDPDLEGPFEPNFTPTARGPFVDPQRRGAGPVPANIHRTQTLAAVPRTLLLVDSSPPVEERFEFLGCTIGGGRGEEGELGREVAEAAGDIGL